MIICKNDVKNLGTIKEGVPCNFEFQIENSGTEIIEDMKGEASCGCTSPRLEQTTLEPGQSMKVFVSFDSLGKVGNVIKAVYVKYMLNGILTRCQMKFNVTIIK